jgi:hypothetical protein
MNGHPLNNGRSETLAETENYTAWRDVDETGEVTYHLELGGVTCHFFQDEWDELLDLFNLLSAV